MSKIYFISGLGADKRAFHQLNLPGFEKIFIDWIQPMPNETIQTYT